MTTFPYLELDCISMDTTVMKLLPPEIAYRYHALPVATDGKKITIAMAAPENPVASNAVQSIFDKPICLIQADREAIDHTLDELWPQVPEKQKYLFWPLTVASNQSYNIAKGIARSLKAKLMRIDCPGNGRESIVELRKVICREEPDLLIIQADHPSKLCKALSFRKSDIKTKLPDLLILPPDPTLPIKKVLLVLPDSGSDCHVLASWVLRIAKSNKVDVTILPVLPPVPLCYGSFLHYTLNSLLEGTDPLANNLRSISKQFSRKNISATYKLREGDPFTQIREEITFMNPDLIIMPSHPQNGRENWLCTDLVSMLFKYITKPIMIINRLGVI